MLQHPCMNMHTKYWAVHTIQVNYKMKAIIVLDKNLSEKWIHAGTIKHHRYKSQLWSCVFSLPSWYEQHLPGADNILDIENINDHCDPVNKCITYLGATSTTERFPIFSPAAEIEERVTMLMVAILKIPVSLVLKIFETPM